MPNTQPHQPPPGHTIRQSQPETAAELLTLTWQFFSQASPDTRHELRVFLTSHDCHPATALGWFLDSLQFTAHSLSQPPPAELPDTIRHQDQ